MLQEFIAVNRDEIIRRCRAKVASRSMPPATVAEIDHGVPLFLEQLIDVVRAHGSSTEEIRTGAVVHGHDLLVQGLTVAHIVYDYGDVCQSITELAMETDAAISTEEFRTLNRCLDDAIAGAVAEYGRARQASSAGGDPGAERLGFFAHELRNLTGTALAAFEVLRTGNVGVTGSTGAVLHRSLIRLTALIGRSLEEVRLTRGVQHVEKFFVAGFIEEVAAAAALDARTKGLSFTIAPVEDGVAVEADRQVLAAVLHNLLQNAFKFTRPGSHVTLRVKADAARVMIEVEDECGGLPGHDAAALFRPFEQRSADRTGLGLGLAFSRWAVEANNGLLSTRNLPGKGCVFAIDVPRCSVLLRF
jgi:signal transduction histidine kinase